MSLPVLSRRTVALAALSLFAMLVAAIALVTAPPPLPLYGEVVARWRPSESWLYDRNGQLLDSARVDFAARRLAWVPLDRMSPALVEAVMASEDRRFLRHEGIDWLALAGALRARAEGRHARGASTLSMQVAAFVAPGLPRPGARGWRDKLRQMRAALALEASWSKPQILTAYLNLASFRGEAQGVGTAALTLFGKAPDALSRDEALLLAALLPDPGGTPEAVARRACTIGGGRDCGALRMAAATMLAGGAMRALDPGLAPHLAARMLTRPGMRVATTLDLAAQRAATLALRRQLQGLGPNRARDGAVVVLDNASGDLIAYVGGVGAGTGLGSTAASVDGAAAHRQAGSTLKPFLYAQAIERGWLTAASILDDSPVQLDTASGLYVPQNYDHSFKGPVSVRTALAGSLNVPAVRTLLLTGVQPFRDRLWDLGYAGMTQDGSYYGFSLALGSAEVSLVEQANAYRALANGGRWSPVRMRPSEPHMPPRQIVAPAAAWIVSDILADPAARAGTFGVDSALRLPFWAAAKTGTSKAMRDNWCVGFSGRFTVAVWVGNLEGDSMKAVSGTSGAAPVWRDVMLALHAGRPGRAPASPAAIERRRIAFAGGIEPPRSEWFLRGTGQGLQAAVPPAARRPRIVAPVTGTVFALDPDIPADRQGMGVEVAGTLPGHRLVLDRSDLGDAGARPLLRAGPGTHRLALVDPSGRIIDQVRFVVR